MARQYSTGNANIHKFSIFSASVVKRIIIRLATVLNDPHWISDPENGGAVWVVLSSETALPPVPSTQPVLKSRLPTTRG